MKAERKGILIMLLCAVLWSMAGICFKYIPWHPLVIAGSRALFAGLTVLAYIRWKGMPVLLNRHTLLTGGAMCATCTLFVFGNKLTTAANAIVLQYTAPVFLLLFSVLFLHKRFRRADVLAVLFTLGGIALFFFDRMDGGRLWGNLISVGAGLSMGLMYMCMGEAGTEERFSSILVAEAMTVLIALPLLFTRPPELSALPVSLVIFLGIFQLGIPYLLYAKASQWCSALVCVLMAALEPLLNPLWVFLIYGEKPGLFALLGGAVVIVTITVWSARGEAGKTEDTHEATGSPAGEGQ